MPERAAPIATLIVDDEPLARTGLCDLLAKDEEITIVAQCASGPQAVEAIRKLRPELVLLDVQMPGMDGFEVLERLSGEPLPVCIFVTAFDRHSVRAFEVHALDYVLKPVEERRFAQALSRAKHRIRERQVARFGEQVLAMLGGALVPEPGTRYLTRLVLKSTRRTVLLPVEDVDWIEGASYYVRVHAQGKEHLLRETLGALEERLDPRRFFRAHRSALVNLERIVELVSDAVGGTTIVLRNGERTKLSRTRRAALERVLGRAI